MNAAVSLKVATLIHPKGETRFILASLPIMANINPYIETWFHQIASATFF